MEKMELYFKSICSSSKGNCVALWNSKTCVLMDFGFQSMRRARAELRGHLGKEDKVDAVVLSHIHTDHISHYSLRVLEECGIEVYIHADSIDFLKRKHFRRYGFADLKLRPFRDEAFTIGEIEFQPFEINHNPAYDTFGYNVNYSHPDGDVKIAMATDLRETESCLNNFTDCDFIYLEANHDLELLRKYYNHNSVYHLSNPKAAEFLTQIITESDASPHTVVLGHLSEQRNTPELAVNEVCGKFEEKGIGMEFELFAVPPKGNSPVFKVAG